MNVLFIASMSVVAADPPQSRKLFIDALGLPLEKYEADEYYSSESIPGSKHFGVWPLSQAADEEIAVEPPAQAEQGGAETILVVEDEDDVREILRLIDESALDELRIETLFPADAETEANLQVREMIPRLEEVVLR